MRLCRRQSSRPESSDATRTKSLGHQPLVARLRHLNDKKIPDYWRWAD